MMRNSLAQQRRYDAKQVPSFDNFGCEVDIELEKLRVPA